MLVVVLVLVLVVGNCFPACAPVAPVTKLGFTCLTRSILESVQPFGSPGIGLHVDITSESSASLPLSDSEHPLAMATNEVKVVTKRKI